MRHWISWYEPGDAGDYRPLTTPPEDVMLGWWCTGVRSSDEAGTLCALVQADDEDAAKALIGEHWEPESWRFCNEVDEHWVPPADRFPRPE
jgi:hypothetical protein